MSKMKRCVQCGILKEEEDFRLYTYSRHKETGGRYRICKGCENINSNYRRALKLVSEAQDANMLGISAFEYQKQVILCQKTEKLYDALEAKGMRTPRLAIQQPDTDTDPVDKLLLFYDGGGVMTIERDKDEGMPDELTDWLNADTNEWKAKGLSPEFLQETIYESLKAKYRPQVGVDKVSFLPLYDDTYKSILNRILRKFDDYEEEFNTGEDENVQV